MLDSSFGNSSKCFIYSFAAGFLGAVLFLYFIEKRDKSLKPVSAESAPSKPLRLVSKSLLYLLFISIQKVNQIYMQFYYLVQKKISGECKMVLVVRKDLKLTKREVAASVRILEFSTLVQ